MRVVEVLKVISFGSETRLYAAARCDLHIGLETVGGYWPIAASYDGLLSTLGLRCPRAAIGHKLPFTCPQKDAQRILLKEENEKELE